MKLIKQHQDSTLKDFMHHFRISKETSILHTVSGYMSLYTNGMFFESIGHIRSDMWFNLREPDI